MRILIHDYPGHPFQVQLSRQLAKGGHQVTHLYAGHNQTPRGDLDHCENDPELFSIKPIYISQPLQKYSFFKRWKQEREYGSLLANQIASIHPDIIISANTPLDTQSLALSQARRLDIPFVIWFQDVIGVATQKILQKKIPLAGDLIGRYYLRMERRLLRESDHIIPISEDFLPLIEQWGIPIQKVTVIPNWAPIENLPVRPKTNPWAVKYGLEDKFCFMYTGTLGMKHNPNLLLQLALSCQERENVLIVVISEGTGEVWLKDKSIQLNLQNLLILPYQPFEQLADVMGTADVLVAILEPDAGVFSVPSKVLSYLCAQRPLLLAIPEENLAARIVNRTKAGIVVSPSEMDEFINGANKLLNHPLSQNYFAENARYYAETNFQIEKILEKFEIIFRQFSH